MNRKFKDETSCRRWRNRKKPHITAEQGYPWLDRVLILDESKPPYRTVIQDTTIDIINDTDWEFYE